MTRNGWCRTNYHSNGKRGFDRLTNELCSECQLKAKGDNQVNRIQKQIADLESERDLIHSEIEILRSKLQNLVKPELIEL